MGLSVRPPLRLRWDECTVTPRRHSGGCEFHGSCTVTPSWPVGAFGAELTAGVLARVAAARRYAYNQVGAVHANHRLWAAERDAGVAPGERTTHGYAPRGAPCDVLFATATA